MESRTALRVRRVVLGWCVGGGAIRERREGEWSQNSAEFQLLVKRNGEYFNGGLLLDRSSIEDNGGGGG